MQHSVPLSRLSDIKTPYRQAEYEAGGSVIIPLSCGMRTCQTNSTDHKGIFTSLNPVKHARVIRHNKRGVAWSYDLTN